MSTNRSDNAADMMSEATEAAADMLPMDMVKAVAELVDPAAAAKQMPWLAEELTKIALGQSDIAPDQRDQRFADEAWRTIPSFRMLGQSYRLLELWMNRMQESVDGSWQDKARARFAAAAGSTSSATALTMSIGSMSAAAPVTSDIMPMASSDLLVLMTSPGAPYAARPERRPAIPGLTVVSRPGPG